MKKLMTAMMMAVAMTSVQAEEKLVIDGSTTVGPIAKAVAELYMRQNPGSSVTVSESGSGNGAKALLNGTCDIACLSRALKDSERKAMTEKGVKPVKHIAALDALSVVVHPSNKVKGLTIDQIRSIYTGKVTNWKEFGGADRRIIVISRDSNSGTYETFHELVLGKSAQIVASAEYAGSNGAVRQRVQTTAGAIGYVGLGFVDSSVKALAVNGVQPSPETALSKQYSLTRELFLFTNGEPAAGSIASKFIALLRSKLGSEAVEELGFIPYHQ